MTNRQFIEIVRLAAGSGATAESYVEALIDSDLAFVQALCRLANQHRDEDIITAIEAVWPEGQR